MLNYIYQQNKYKKLVDEIVKIEGTAKSTSFCVGIDNATDNALLFLLAKLFKETDKTLVYVLPTIYDATKNYERLMNILSPDEVCFFPGEEPIASVLVASSNTYRLARMATIEAILEQSPRIIVTNTEGITRNLMSKERLLSALLHFKKNETVPRDELIEDLITRGYKKTAITESPGTFSVRGSVIDIYGVNLAEPVRLSFFDDEIESIRYFSVETQKSTRSTDKVTIYPLYEMYYKPDELDKIIARVLEKNPLNEKITQDIESLKAFQTLDQLYIYLPYIDQNYERFLDAIDQKIVVYNDFSRILDKEQLNILETSDYFTKVDFVGDEKFYESVKDTIPLTGLVMFVSSHSVYIEGISLHKKWDLKTTNNYDYNNNLKHLIEDIRLNKGKTYIITSLNERRQEALADLLFTNGIPFKVIDRMTDFREKTVNLTVNEQAYGFIDYELNIEIITPNEMAKGTIPPSKKMQAIYKETVKIYSKEDILIGDYVVHPDYGIGKYQGIKSVKLKDVVNDYVLVEYAEDNKLYIPVENISVLEKYVGTKDVQPKLSKFGSKEWEKKKAKIKEKVNEIAKMLVKTQAQRELMKGYRYPPDSEEQLQFERDFGFIETEGQLKAIADLKKDLEGPRPVDRLLCGDVGYGKTEVAMRGAFKVVEAGKQVAYLAPTTVLARQHYLTFKERFEKYGVRVELLSRFVDSHAIKTTLDGLRNGYVDIVIGTHRLLSDDVKFKDLGLLIIDEEHRFGVEHKERIKAMKANVDVLSLSATPIPRTLQMALTGLRDLSLIETPPFNRLSVQTYVLETNDSVIREAIRRELGRGGQVFYLLNRISQLSLIERKLKRLVPEAHFTIIHGKMSKDQIEEAINDFIDRRYDILICTTIIETGIDIPNANTIIIEKADILGLAQLYQIRGRVGRSDRIAYAYLMYDKGRILTESAQKRLDTIKEFTALGSGYKIAMRDLSIRGAGDILGSEQSGFIDAVGIELYLKMLNEAIQEEKGLIVPEDKKQFDVRISKHISENYVDDDIVRIEMHKSINKIKSREEAENIRREFADRYGQITSEIDLYIEGKYLTFLLKSKGVAAFKESEKTVEFHFDKDKSNQITYKDLQRLNNLTDLKLEFNYKYYQIYITIYLTEENKNVGKSNYIYQLTKLLENV